MEYKEYDGPINKSKMSKLALKAKIIFYGQSKRCYTKSNKEYKYYGAKGIRQEYTLRQFIYWYLQQYPEAQKKWKRVICGRIDHDKNYSLNNIRLESAQFSNHEKNGRCGLPNPEQSIKAKNLKSGVVFEFKSRRDATVRTGVSRKAMKKHLDGIVTKPRGDWFFFL